MCLALSLHISPLPWNSPSVSLEEKKEQSSIGYYGTENWEHDFQHGLNSLLSADNVRILYFHCSIVKAFFFFSYLNVPTRSICTLGRSAFTGTYLGENKLWDILYLYTVLK